MLAQFRYEAGAWEVDGDRRELRAHGQLVPLGSRAFQIIEKLARSAGEYVSKDDLLAHVWPGVFVEDNTLRVHIHAIRKALGPDRTLLKTDAGRGYRLLGRWETKADGADPSKPAAIQTSSPLARSNLPATTSGMVGREATIQQLRDLVSAFRAVTLAGPAGIGKTTLAIELARTLIPEFEESACFVELASLADPTLVPSTVTAALGLQTGARVNSAEEVARAIGSTKLLLVLDNCEHVVDAAARLAEEIVRQCPHTSILATSREVLRIEGERVYRVPALDVPESQERDPERLRTASAVELFIARAQASDDRFFVDRASLAAVADICRQLDGIPLAIEFAAARAATLGVQQVAVGLRDRFSLLIRQRRTALPRHRTLRAALDWSYELLSDDEQALLQRLAIFAGSFDLGDVTAIAEDPDAVELLSGLVDKSLVVAETVGLTALFRLLDTNRAYAVEKLEASGELEAVARRHAEHHRYLFERIEAEWEARSAVDLHDSYAGRIGNLRAALEWAFSERGDPSIAVALMTAACPLFMHLSLFDECCARIEQAFQALRGLGTTDLRREMKLRIAFAASAARSGAFVATAKVAWERALALAEQCDDVDGRRLALHGLWVVEHRNALELAQRFLDLANSPLDRAVGRVAMATTLHHRGNHEEARRLVDDVIAQYESATRPPVTGIVRYQRDEWMAAYSTRARILWLQGCPHQAVQVAQRSVDRARRVNHPNSICQAISMAIGPLAILNGDLERSQHCIDLLKDQMTRHGLSFWRGWIVCYEAMLARGRGNPSGVTDWLNVGSEVLAMQKHWRMVPFFFAELALVLGQNGRIDDGLEVVDKAIEREDARWLLPDLLRVKGELLILKNAAGANADAANCFREAIAEAQRQAALAWELRAATSLARRLRAQGRAAEAGALLRPVYGRFTEGFDTPDLTAARALLDSLNNS